MLSPMLDSDNAIARLRIANSAADSLSSPSMLSSRCMVVALMNRVNRTNPVTRITTKSRVSWAMLSFSRIANASANDTAPRKPPQNITVLYPVLTFCSMPIRLSNGISA